MKLVDFSLHGIPWDNDSNHVWARVTVEHGGKLYLISKDQMISPLSHELTPATKLELLSTTLVELVRRELTLDIEKLYGPTTIKL